MRANAPNQRSVQAALARSPQRRPRPRRINPALRNPWPGSSGWSRRGPNWAQGSALYRRLGGLFADAAGALAHLHERGIIHRDVKPSNLMLTGDGRRIVLMDLGLAQLRDRSQSLTRESTRWLGTLRYCAPEQLTHNLLSVDERAALYGLGATLFELTTLAPLFDGDSEERLIQQVLHQEAPDPRKLERSVPADLAAIILHCIDKDRTRRYSSAHELAEDLRRFRDGEAVRARPIGTPERVWRWSKRNPLTAGLTGAVAALTLAVAVVETLDARHQREAKRRIEEALVLAENGEKAAKEAKQAADELIDYMQYDVSEALGKLGRLDLMDAINARIRRYHEEHPPEAGDTAARDAADRQRSVALDQQGDILRAQGDLAGALKSYRDSLGIREKLAKQDPGNAGWQRDLSVSYERVGEMQRAQGDLAGALKSYRDSLGIAEKLVKQDPSNAGWQNGALWWNLSDGFRRMPRVGNTFFGADIVLQKF